MKRFPVNHWIPAFAGMFLLLAACDSKTVLEGERSPVFAEASAPGQAAKPLDSGLGGGGEEKLELRRAYRTNMGIGPDDRIFQWPAIAAEGKIFTVNGILVASAFDIATGKRLWRSRWTRDSAPIWFGDIAYGDGAVFVITSDGRISKFSAESGERLKENKFSVRLKSGATFCEGRVFFAGDENELYALDAATLETAFIHRALSEPFQFMNAARPLCEGGKIFAPFSNGELHALDAKSGKVLWLASVTGAKVHGSFADIIAPPIAAGKAVISKSFYGPMRAFDMASGKELWNRPSDGAASPLYANGVLFDVAGTRFCALDAATGASFYCLSLEGRRTYFSPVMAGGELLLARDDGFIEVRSPDNGRLLRKEKLIRRVTADPFVYGDMLILQRSAAIRAFR